MPATDILGKIGETVGGEIKSLRTTLTGDLATKVSLGNVQTQVTTNAGAITDLDTAKASKVSLANYANGTSVFSQLNATRATTTGDVTVGGNLTVNGTTTTVNSTVVEVEDNAIEVNLKSDGAATANTAGLIVNRGEDVDKAQFLFDDTVDKFTLKVGTALGTLNVATVEAALTGNVTGNVAGDLTGGVTAGAGKVVAVATGNGFTINSTSIGDYSTFETAFNTAKV